MQATKSSPVFSVGKRRGGRVAAVQGQGCAAMLVVLLDVVEAAVVTTKACQASTMRSPLE